MLAPQNGSAGSHNYVARTRSFAIAANKCCGRVRVADSVAEVHIRTRAFPIHPPPLLSMMEAKGCYITYIANTTLVKFRELKLVTSDNKNTVM